MEEAQSQCPWSEQLFPIFDELVKKGKQIFHDSGGRAEINFDTPSEIILPLTARELVKENKSPPDDFSLCVLLGDDLLQCIHHEEEDEPTWKIYIHDTKYFNATAFADAVDSSNYRGYDPNALTKVELVKKLFEMLNSKKKLSSVDFVNILLGIQQINSSGILNNIRDISKRTMLSKYEESPNKRKLAALFEFITLFSNKMVSNIRYKSSADKFVIQTEISTFFHIFTTLGKQRLPFKALDLTYLLDLTKSRGYPGFEINRTSIYACFDMLEFCYQIIIENLSNVRVITRNNEIIYYGFLKAMTDANGDSGDNFSVENIKAILARKRANFREAAAAQAASRAAAAQARAAAAQARAAATAATNQSDNVQARLARSYGGKRFKRKEASNFHYSKQRSLCRKNKSRKNKSRKNKSRKNKSRKNKSRKNKSRK